MVELQTEFELTEEQEEQIQQMFDLFDIDKDGKISEKEIEKAMQLHGMSPTDGDVTDILSAMDRDGSGFVDFPEFREIMATLFKENKYEEDVEELRKAFRIFDRDKNGILDRNEFNSLVNISGACLDDGDFDDLFDEVDTDHSGGISIDELIEAFTKPPESIVKKTTEDSQKSAENKQKKNAAGNTTKKSAQGSKQKKQTAESIQKKKKT